MDHAQHLHSQLDLHFLSMDKNNPLQAILEKNLWYPKTSYRIAVCNHHPLLYPFLNQPAVFTPHFDNLEQTSLPVLSEKILYDLILQKYNQIRSIVSKSPKLVQICTPSLLTDPIPGMDCDAVLTAPAAYQAHFLAWRRGVVGRGRQCICGERFDTGHTTGMPYPDPGLTEEQQFILDLDSELLDPGIKYLIVVFLLNQRL